MTTATRERLDASKTAPAKPKRSVRADIQGLRAIAVVAVVLDHLLGWPSGGFVGVDVFFVISGFLITGLLLREHDRTGTISFADFYRRRIRRITPAATVVLAVTVAAAFLIFAAGRAMNTLWDSIWAFFFAANWHFAAVGTDYFQAEGPESPLQHFWSLAVEEQFYFVWPALMFVIFLLAGRNARWNKTRAHQAVGLAMIILVAASFAWAMYETTASPTWAYFSTFSRAWELGIGALIAVSAGVFTKIPAAARPVLGWIGFAGIVVSVFTINDGMAFPAPWAALPVLATGLVIVAGTGGEQRFLWPLTNPVSGYIGNVSYSLYLWHFPVIILLAAVIPATEPMYMYVAVVLMSVLSVASYQFIERGVLESNFLVKMTKEERKHAARKPSHHHSTSVFQSQNAIVGLILLAVVASGSVALVVVPSEPSSATTEEVLGVDDFTTDESHSPAVALTPEQQATADAQSALAVREWGELDPALDFIADSGSPEWLDDNCLNVITEVKSAACTYGDGDKTAVLLGDSYALSWLPGLRDALEPQGWKIQLLTLGACPNVMLTIDASTGVPIEVCDEHHEWVPEQLERIQPDMIIMADKSTYGTQITGQVKDVPQPGLWKTATDDFIKAVKPTTDKLVVIGSPPGSGNLQSCFTPVGGVAGCNKQLDTVRAVALNNAEKEAAEANDVTYVDPLPWLCARSNCPAVIGTTPVYSDGQHMTQAFSKKLAPLLATAIGDAPTAE
jgi:peptidoglycan/LPS O-acetylase OafA/YrhL